MPHKPYQNTDLIIYEDITSGKLHPSLPRYEDMAVLQGIIHEANTQTFSTCGLEEDPVHHIESFDFSILGYRFREDAEIRVLQNSKKRIHELIAKPVRIYSLEECIDFPAPPGKKAAYFLALISDEFERIKIRANAVLKSTTKKKHLATFAHRNIQRAKKIQFDLKVSLQKTHKPWTLVTDNPDVYVIFVLNIFLDRIITFYKDLFEPFIISFPCQDAPKYSAPSIPVDLKYPFMFRENPQVQEGYDLKMQGSIFDHQFMSQVNRLKDFSVGETSSPDSFLEQKKSLSQQQEVQPLIQLKCNGQLNVLVDLFLRLANFYRVNDLPFLEATPDQLRLFLQQSFLDKEARQLSAFTLETYLDPRREDKKLHPDSPKRIDLSGFFKEQDSTQE